MNRPYARRGALETQPQTSQEPADGLDGFTLKKVECAAGGPGTAESATLVRRAVQAQLDQLEWLVLRIAKLPGVRVHIERDRSSSSGWDREMPCQGDSWKRQR